MKTCLLVTIVFVVILGLLASSAPVAAQETNPAAVIKAVYDAVAAKDIDNPKDFGTSMCLGLHPEKHHFPFNVCLVGYVGNLYNIN